MTQRSRIPEGRAQVAADLYWNSPSRPSAGGAQNRIFCRVVAIVRLDEGAVLAVAGAALVLAVAGLWRYGSGRDAAMLQPRVGWCRRRAGRDVNMAGGGGSAAVTAIGGTAGVGKTGRPPAVTAAPPLEVRQRPISACPCSGWRAGAEVRCAGIGRPHPPVFRTREIRPGSGALCAPGPAVLHADRAVSPARRPPHHNGDSPVPRRQYRHLSGAASSRGISQGFTSFARPAFPSPAAPG